MKILLMIMYILVTLYACNQMTYRWWSAGACCTDNPEAKEYNTHLFYAFGVLFLLLIAGLFIFALYSVFKRKK